MCAYSVSSGSNSQRFYAIMVNRILDSVGCTISLTIARLRTRPNHLSYCCDCGRCGMCEDCAEIGEHDCYQLDNEGRGYEQCNYE